MAAAAVLQMMKEKMKQVGRIPRNGWCYYAGFWKTDDGKVHSFATTIEPFAPIGADRAMFIADYRFHTEALHDLLEASAGPAYGCASLVPSSCAARACSASVAQHRHLRLHRPAVRQAEGQPHDPPAARLHADPPLPLLLPHRERPHGQGRHPH